MVIHNDLSNLTIAELLRNVAATYILLEDDKNKFRIIAYERAADAIEHLSSEIKDIWDEGKLEEIPGVGTSIAEHLNELFKNGKSFHFDDLMKNIPQSVFKLMELPRIGAKTAFKLVKELNLENSKDPISDLEKKAKEGLISPLEGFGEESQKDILRSIEELRRMVKRHLLPYALNIANKIISWLKEGGNIVKVDPLGSLRRLVSTVGDIDISVATNNPVDVIERFVGYKKADRIIEKGSKTASILLPGNVQVDLMVQDPDSYGSLLQHFTGSKHHNIALREFALKRSLSLSEYGITPLHQGSAGRGRIKRYKTEEEFYNYIGLEYIPPELREDAGEIEAAENHKIPNLITLKEIKGDLQIHSDFDTQTSHDLGESTMNDLVGKGNKLNYEYLAFTDHNPSKSNHNEKIIIEILKRRKEKIEELNYSLAKNGKSGVRKVYNSLEIDILSNGELSIPESALEMVDFALVSIHSAFNQSKGEATKRVISGLSNPKALIFAHPTGRLLNKREGVEFDWPKIFEFCLKENKFIEINGDPMRLDLPDFLVREAIKVGIKLSFGTDSHHQDGMDNMQWAISVARRGWARSSDIINTLNFSDFEKLIKGRG